MSNRFIGETLDSTPSEASQPAAATISISSAIGSFIATARHTLMILGIIAIAALAAMFVKPELADELLALSPFAAANAEEAEHDAPSFTDLMNTPAQPVPESGGKTLAAVNADINKVAANERQQQWVTNWLSKRYRVAADATNMLVSAAYLTAREIKLDPLLILSVMAIESGFNPFAESPVGAQGLMQVMSKVHHDKFEELGGVKAALNPVANIKVGSLILKDYVTRGGSVEAGLKLYVGAGAAETDSGYGAKVLAEYRRLKEVAMGKKVPVFATASSPPPASLKPRQQDNKEENASEAASSSDPAQAPAKERTATL